MTAIESFVNEGLTLIQIFLFEYWEYILPGPNIENMYKCKSFEEWIILAGVFMLILIISLFKYKTLVPIIKPLVLKIVPLFLTNQEIDVDVASNYLTEYNTTEL